MSAPRAHSTVGALMLASLAFMIVSVVRMRMTASQFGAETLGAFSQASLLQLAAASVATSGLVTAGRIAMSDGNRTRDEHELFARRIMARPPLAAAMLLPIGLLAGRPLAELLMGSTEWHKLTIYTVMGVVPLVMAQGALAVIQVLGSPRELIAGAVNFTVVGSGAIWLLLRSADQGVASTSYLIVPLLQLAALLVASKTLRLVLLRKRRPAISSPPASGLGLVGAASLSVGLTTMGVELLLRSHLAHEHGLATVALLQPGLLLAVAGVGIFTSAASQATMVWSNQQRHKNATHTNQFREGPWQAAASISVLVAAVAAGVMLFSPLLIPLFFTRSLLPGTMALSIYLAAEPLRALVWVGASTLLPQRRTWAWLCAQASGLASFTTVALLFTEEMGEIAYALGAAAGVIANLLVSLLILHPRALRREEYVALAIAACTSATVVAHGKLNSDFSGLALTTTAVTATAESLRRFSKYWGTRGGGSNYAPSQ